MTWIDVLHTVSTSLIQGGIYVGTWEAGKAICRGWGKHRNEGETEAQTLAKRSKELERTTIEKEEAFKKAFNRLTDVDAIQEDMEASARAREMYDAGRTTLPREDGAAHAVVHRPKLRAPKPATRTHIDRKGW